jgi:hypothetical protein
VSAPHTQCQPEAAALRQHTPTPWYIIAGDDYYITAEDYPKEFIGRFKGDDNGGYLAVVGNRPADFGEANAAFIVEAVNNHAALQQSCEELGDMVKARDAQLFVAERESAALKSRVEELTKALSSAAGYLRNASIDLSTGCTKATARQTIDGGLRMVEAALVLKDGAQ